MKKKEYSIEVGGKQLTAEFNDLADQANGVKNEALHEFFEVSVVENEAFLGKCEADFVNNEVCLTNCEGAAEKNEVCCGNFEGSAKKSEAHCENFEDGAVKNEVRLENFKGDFVINEERFELEEGFFRQDYRIIRIDSCVSSSVLSVSSVVNSASFGSTTTSLFLMENSGKRGSLSHDIGKPANHNADSSDSGFCFF